LIRIFDFVEDSAINTTFLRVWRVDSSLVETDLKAYIAADVRMHPRVAHQELFSAFNVAEKMVAALPALPSFRKTYAGAITIVDWDHKLPSQALTLRIYGYYSEESLDAGYQELDERVEQIAERDKYPEFDVPDFEGLDADESYDIELSVDGIIGRCRLTSAWRRSVAPNDGNAAIALVQNSEEYQKLVAASPQRPGYLGDLEAVSWTPPCESEHPVWTLDVWFLMTFDGRIGSGRSFLVDLADAKVVAARDFSVRTG
jgi:hypothetical protein